MGIKLLSSFIKNNCKNVVVQKHLSCFYGKTITIDVSIYIYRYKVEKALIEKMFLLCNTLNYYKINAIFVFDGKTPEEKKQTILNRQQERNDALCKLTEIKKLIETGNLMVKHYL